MQHILLLTLFLPLFTSAQTNWDEYHFATKGYAAVVAGTDKMMDGYKVDRNTPTQLSNGDTMIFCRLIDDDVDRVVCGIIIINRAGSPARYLCLPHPESSKELINQCIRDYQTVFPGYKGGVSDAGLQQLFGLTMASVTSGK